MREAKTELLRGTRDRLILKVVAWAPATACYSATPSIGIFLQVDQGSRYSALHCLEDKGLLQAEWKNPKLAAMRSSTPSPRKAVGRWTPKSSIGAALRRSRGGSSR